MAASYSDQFKNEVELEEVRELCNRLISHFRQPGVRLGNFEKGNEINEDGKVVTMASNFKRAPGLIAQISIPLDIFKHIKTEYKELHDILIAKPFALYEAKKEDGFCKLKVYIDPKELLPVKIFIEVKLKTLSATLERITAYLNKHVDELTKGNDGLPFHSLHSQLLYNPSFWVVADCIKTKEGESNEQVFYENQHGKTAIVAIVALDTLPHTSNRLIQRKANENIFLKELGATIKLIEKYAGNPLIEIYSIAIETKEALKKTMEYVDSQLLIEEKAKKAFLQAQNSHKKHEIQKKHLSSDAKEAAKKIIKDGNSEKKEDFTITANKK